MSFFKNIQNIVEDNKNEELSKYIEENLFITEIEEMSLLIFLIKNINLDELKGCVIKNSNIYFVHKEYGKIKFTLSQEIEGKLKDYKSVRLRSINDKNNSMESLNNNYINIKIIP